MGVNDHHPPNQNKNGVLSSKLKSNSTFKICTYNVRSLASIERHLELSYALENINWDIMGLSEVRKQGCNIEEYQKHILCYKGQTKGLHGVGFLIKKEHKDKITAFQGISERVALLQLTLEDLSITLIQVYAPTEKSSEEEINQFYNDIEKAHLLSDDIVLVMGDFNAKIGCPRVEESFIMGKYGIGERNERGERLIDFAAENKLSIMNTFFKKKESRKWTWISPDKKTKNEIDFILTNSPKIVTNIEVLSNMRYPSDHRPVRANILLRLPRKSRKNFKSPPYIPKTEKDIKVYVDNLKTHLGSVQSEPADVQTYNNLIAESIAASLKINSTALKRRHKIFSEETEELIRRRTELIHTKHKDKEMKNELRKLFKETKRSIKKDYNNYRHEVITRNLNKHKSTKKAFKELTLQKTWIQKLHKNSEETKTRQDVKEHATNFYKELYRSRDKEEMEQTIAVEFTSNPIEPIAEKEVYDSIKKLKNEKSPGPDGLSNEAVKLGAPVLTRHLTQLFNMVLDTETVPKQWCTSDIILLYKKGDPLDIGNYRPISLLASIYKLFASIVLKRITHRIDTSQPIEQAGFRSGYSTTDHIQTLEQVIEKYSEFNRPLYVAFIDYSKAFDSISHSSIWNALIQFKVDRKYINIIKKIYDNSTSKVKLETRGDPIHIERGVRQGDPLSPKLFIAVLENIFRQLDWAKKGIRIGNRYLSHLRFADDIVILAETPKDLETMIESLDQESSRVGLEMNASKTNIMTNSRKRTITVKGNRIEYVDSYIYLGKQVSFNKKNNEEEVTRRVNLTWRRFWSLKEVLKGNYNLHMKKVVMDTCLLPCLLYGCQTWVFTKKVQQKITSTQRAMERSILKIRKIHKIKSEKIRNKTKVIDALSHALTLKWRWAGHISRYMDKRWTMETTRWKGPSGKRSVGRPKRRWADDLDHFAGKDWMTLARNRELWMDLEEAFTQKGVHISETEKLKLTY